MVALRALVLLLPLLLAAGCADSFITADCEGELELVVKGESRGFVVDVESREVKGGVDTERFWLSFPDPERGIEIDAADWLVELGFNPMGGYETLGSNLRNNMLPWYEAPGSPAFSVEAKDAGGMCDVVHGHLCGRLGMDRDGNGEIDTGETTAESYHRITSGTVAFSELRPEAWRATFELVVAPEEQEETVLGGTLTGCFRAALHQEGSGHYEFR